MLFLCCFGFADLEKMWIVPRQKFPHDSCLNLTSKNPGPEVAFSFLLPNKVAEGGQPRNISVLPAQIKCSNVGDRPKWLDSISLSIGSAQSQSSFNASEKTQFKFTFRSSQIEFKFK